MKIINPAHWQPSDGLILEENALRVVKSNFHSLVIAGPGAGKTELLAQRASYLLQTNLCISPRRILAISFKADAAANLKERVLLRCGPELSKRFDSLTFDAFAKSLFDRFKNSLPRKFQTKNNYNVALTDSPVLDQFKYRNLNLFNSNTKDKILRFFYNPGLPYPINNKNEELKDSIWMNLLSAEKPMLSFKMIMRLAELIILANPILKKYLQQTYQYIFLDEFQDTTTIQYEFLRCCFFQCDSIITAVGDDKQRIMIWAGAKETAFEDLTKDIGAAKVPLFMNFRSAPRLVELQNYLVNNLMKKVEVATPSEKWNIEDGICDIWIFENQRKEMELLLNSVKDSLANGIYPRDICILVKQQLKVYVGDLIDYFNSSGIKARDETELQNLLAEPLVLYLINMLYCSFKKKASNERNFVFDLLRNYQGVEGEIELLKLESKLSSFQISINNHFDNGQFQDTFIYDTIQKIIDFLGLDIIKSEFPSYKEDEYLQYVIKNFSDNLYLEWQRSSNMVDALDNLLGKDTIPVMTVHKSKGLEYNTVIFVGLEDNAFWSYQNQPDEDRCTFFVALSRAKNRVIFTFSKTRTDKFNRVQPQNMKNIRDILNGLVNSNLATVTQF
ncbi:UvrD-helicase domain-containing protein [Sphingobacterium siyangense]|uniref:UvrD-helicase domain-containing protein n=1 Tax=Sphingobacterium siyangense TaxID=459529 RepID=UPI003DA2210B